MQKSIKRLTLNKEKLQTLTDTSLERVQGGAIYNPRNSDWCSSMPNQKCCSTTVVPR